MSALNVNLRFNGPQFRAYRALRIGATVFLGFGRGVGKSWLLRAICWLLIAEYDGKLRSSALQPFRGVRITWLMPTLTQFADVHWAGIEEELAPGGLWGFLGAKLDRQRRHITFPGGSTLRPFPASEYNARTARGMRTDMLVCDEVDDIPGGVYDAVAVPWLSEPWSLGMQVLAGTPTRGRHGLWWRTLEAGRLGERLRNGEPPPADLDPEAIDGLKSVHAFHATYLDAPETVSPTAVAKAKATIPKATFEREFLADPDAGEGLVYPFDNNFHVRQPPPISVFREFHVGVDHGWVDPAVLILFGIQGHGEDAIVWALDESYESMVPSHEWDERAARWKASEVVGPTTFWADPSRPDRIDAMRSKGCWFGDVDNSILAGVARVADMLFPRHIEGSDERWCKFYVSPKCVNLIREFGLYRRKKLPDGRFGEKPQDKDNHTQDATRYFLYGRFGAPPNYRTEIAA